MTPEQYENAKKELKENKWKLENLTGSDSFTQHMKMHVSLLESLISKHEDCYHINKPFIENIDIVVEVKKRHQKKLKRVRHQQHNSTMMNLRRMETLFI